MTDVERIASVVAALIEGTEFGAQIVADILSLGAERDRLREMQVRHEWGLGQIAAMDVPASRIAKAALAGAPA